MMNPKSRYYDWREYQKELERQDCFVYCVTLYGRLGSVVTLNRCYTTYAAAQAAAERINYIYAEIIVDRVVSRVRVMAE